MMNRIEAIIALRDLLAYSMLYGPCDYPAEDRTTWEEQSVLIYNQFACVRSLVSTADEDIWLCLALESFRNATDRATSGEQGEVRRFLQEAERYLGNAHAGKSSAVTFIAGPTGIEPAERPNGVSGCSMRQK